MAQPTKGQEGYRTPVEQYPDQDNQHSREEITSGAAEEDQLDGLNNNAPENGREDARQADSPPVSDEDINNGK